MSRGGRSETAPIANLDAEMALLGALMFDNAALDMLEVELLGQHFAEPRHQVIFQEIVGLIRGGHLADPITVNGKVQGQPGFEPADIVFLAELVDRAPPAANARDYAKEVLAYALRRDLSQMGAWVLDKARDGGEDPEVVRQEAERILLGLRLDAGRNRPIGAAEAVSQVFEALDAEGASGISTGLAPLDKHLGPMLGGDLIIVAARPGQGKSAWAGCVGTNIAVQQGLGVLEISLEMSVAQLYRRRLCDVAHRLKPAIAPAYSDVRRKQITPAQRELLHESAAIVSALPIVSVARTGVTPAMILSTARRQMTLWLKAGITPGVVIVDHLGLVVGEGKGRYESQTDVALRAKEIATELGLPVIALAQLSRKIEERDDKRPILSDLRDTGALEENADIVIGFYRDAYYAEHEPEPKKEVAWAEWNARKHSKDIEAMLLKVREGRRGSVTLYGDMARNAIRAEAPNDDDFFA